MTNAFVLWMNSLDASEVAANESFHSRNHRDWIHLHEMEKQRIAFEQSPFHSFQLHLTRLSQMWALRDERNSQRAVTTKERVAANPVSFTFTEKQIEIAEKALKKKENK